MSSFDRPHYFYLFRMNNGKRKLAYGATPDDALGCLGLRLSADEMAEICGSDYEKIHQRDLHKYVNELG